MLFLNVSQHSWKKHMKKPPGARPLSLGSSKVAFLISSKENSLSNQDILWVDIAFHFQFPAMNLLRNF